MIREQAAQLWWCMFYATSLLITLFGSRRPSTTTKKATPRIRRLHFFTLLDTASVLVCTILLHVYRKAVQNRITYRVENHHECPRNNCTDDCCYTCDEDGIAYIMIAARIAECRHCAAEIPSNSGTSRRNSA